MKDKPNYEEPNNQESSNFQDKTEGKSRKTKGRREFFKEAALGIGGIALASGSLTSCDDTTKKNKGDKLSATGGNGSSGGKLKNGTPPVNIDKDNWYAPKEVDFTRKKLKSTPLKSTLGGQGFDNIYYLDVDKNTSSAKTPQGESTVLFGYNGTVPGPTIRVKGSDDFTVILKNSLKGNNGDWAVQQGSRQVHDNSTLPAGTLDWQIKGHLYGPHQQHTTNLHTHGLHVSPGVDTKSQIETQYSLHSDNVLLRVIPFEDFENRVLKGKGPALYDNEQVAEALYKFKLPRPDGTPHYPGTHWYHPHPHGATYDQVAGGMAGFLIVEGPVDTYLEEKYAENAYDEKLLLIQRVLAPAPSPSSEDAPKVEIQKGNKKKNKVVKALANGQSVTDDGIQSPTASAYANQVIRLRILNGSVDGQGYVRMMLTKDEGTSATEGPALLNPESDMYSNAACINGKMPKNAGASAKRWCAEEAHGNFICMDNIAFDGINLIDANGDYTSMPVEWLTVGVANRADFLIAIPSDAQPGDSYTLWAQDMTEAVDAQALPSQKAGQPKPYNLRIAQFHVTASDVSLPEPPKNADGSLKIDWKYEGSKLKAEPMLMPITTKEITIQDNSESTSAYLPSNPKTLDGTSFTMNKTGNKGKIRARRLLYSGFGHNSLGNTIKATNSADLYNAMVIDGKKYGADTGMNHGWDTAQHKMLLNTAEEWTVCNYSMTVLQNDKNSTGKPEDYTYGTPAYKATSQQSTVAKGVYHPFHIHQNPFFVRSLQDNEGNELLPIDADGNPIPRWQDTIYLPHNGGRAIFRSRFWDYTGKYVDHCHLLQHEDWGMMQAIEVVDGKNEAPNYLPLPAEATDTQNVFPPLSLRQMYILDVGKVDDVIANTIKSPNDPTMLCYAPNGKTYFDQKELTNIDTGLTVPPSDSDTPFPTWNNSLEGNPIS
ncbi:MAG: multicopper oxidase domain-containing protein [Bacteroidota bacterium]